MKIVFVGGVHGVGKTSTCLQAAELLGWRHESASGIIKKERVDAISAESKHVGDIPGNQELLLRGVRRLADKDTPLILDGHFTLLNSIGGIERVDTEIFKQLGISIFVVLEDKPESILARIQNRDQRAPSEIAISEQQEAEIEHGMEVANFLHVPFKKIQAFAMTDFVESLRQSGPDLSDCLDPAL